MSGKDKVLEKLTQDQLDGYELITDPNLIEELSRFRIRVRKNFIIDKRSLQSALRENRKNVANTNATANFGNTDNKYIRPNTNANIDNDEEEEDDTIDFISSQMSRNPIIINDINKEQLINEVMKVIESKYTNTSIPLNHLKKDNENLENEQKTNSKNKPKKKSTKSTTKSKKQIDYDDDQEDFIEADSNDETDDETIEERIKQYNIRLNARKQRRESKNPPHFNKDELVNEVYKSILELQKKAKEEKKKSKTEANLTSPKETTEIKKALKILL